MSAPEAHAAVLQRSVDERLRVFDLLRLRWININPNSSLRVYGVEQKEIMQYHTTNTNKYNISNLPPDEYRLKNQEVICNEDYIKFMNESNES